jgi:aryl-alcohol dehydrogenase-like predicted oxidoreductase
LGHSPGVIALAWLLHQPGVCATIIGPRTRDQLVDALSVPEVQLSAETLARLDGIFPPCGPAPEAYAW